MYCRDNEVDCVQYVHSRAPNVSSTDQLWRMHEVNKLIWPSPTGLAVMNPSSYSNTVQLALTSGLIHSNPGTSPVVETYAVLALDTLR
jgi:NitT/TauT family transport system substrate-binding protein